MLPSITTPRLILNAFSFDDCERVELFAGREEVARTTANIPHPYPPGAAQLWIATHTLSFLKGESYCWAVRLKDQTLIGSVGLTVSKEHERAELGYWLGVDYWNHGYMTEAATACVNFAWGNLKLQKITAQHLACNPASGRVMEKIGMTKEAYRKNHVKKWGEFHDVAEFGMVRDESA